MIQRPDITNFAILLSVGAIWGGSFGLIKIGLTEFSPLQIVFLRTGIAGLAMLPFALIGRLLLRTRDFFRISGLALVGYVVPFFLISWGELYVPSSLAAVVMATGPLVAFVVARTAGQEAMTVLKAVGLLLGFCGVLLLISADVAGDAIACTQFALGVGAILLATCAYVGAGFLAKTLNHVPSPLLTCMTLLIACAMTAPVLHLTAEPMIVVASAQSWLAILVLAILSTAIAALLRFILIRRAGYVFASYVGYLIPVFGLIYGVALLGEVIAPHGWIAIALIAAGLFTLRAGTASPKRSVQIQKA